MKITLLLLAGLSCALALPSSLEGQDISLYAAFEKFVAEYGRKYAHAAEENMRFRAFVENFYKMVETSGLSKTAEFGINKFSDWTSQELDQLNGLQVPKVHEFKSSLNSTKLRGVRRPASAGIPDSWDWREHGAVNAVKDQKQCGSCWAFSVVAAMEGQHFVKTGKSISLSEQWLLNCDNKQFGGRNGGCRGGFPMWAIEFLMDVGGSPSEEDVPYMAKAQDCKEAPFVVPVKGGIYADFGDAEEIKEMLYKTGPLSVAVNGNELPPYLGGILDLDENECKPMKINHAVTLVGYGVEKGVPFWTVRNSWGPNWGENGYFRIKRGSNTCGIEVVAMRPVLDSPLS